MPTVYRLEDSDGEGAFRSGAVGYAVATLRDEDEEAASLHDPRNHRAPWEDGLQAAIDRQYVFGCRTLAQYQVWFSHPFIRRSLASRGLSLNKYRVSAKHALMGGTQCAFDRSKATVVGTRRPDYADWTYPLGET
jgi:hypothetical protein